MQFNLLKSYSYGNGLHLEGENIQFEEFKPLQSSWSHVLVLHTEQIYFSKKHK